MKTIEKFRISRVLLIAGCIFLCNSFFIEASSVIKGHVMNNKRQPINYATATILNPNTMEIVEGDMCDKKGEFFIENVKPGEYILSVRMVGFEKDESVKIVIDSDTNLVEVKNIVLNESIQQLNELVVTAKRRQNQQNIATNNNVNLRNMNRASLQAENNEIFGLTNQIGNYLKELQSKNVDYTETNDISNFRLEVQEIMVNQYKDLMQSSIDYINNEKH